MRCSACLETRRARPHVCRDCGATFTKTPSQNVSRCEACRESRRVTGMRACGTCQDPFTQNEGQGYANCPACRTGRPESRRSRITVRRECEYCCAGFDSYEPPSVPPRRFCCNEHRLAWFANAFRRQASPHWRGGAHPYGPYWKAMGQAISVRDGHRCRSCGRHEHDLSERLTAAHLVPERAWGGHPELAHHPANLVALCRTCHSWFDRNQETRYDYAAGDRPTWPEWTAQPVGLKVDQAKLILAVHSPESLAERLLPSDLGLDRLVEMTHSMAGQCGVYGALAGTLQAS